MIENAWMTIAQAAEYLQVERTTLYRYMASGKLRYYRVGGSGVRRLKLADLDALMIPDDLQTAEDRNTEPRQ